jgi:branched-chain amino acid transport system permease protein
MVVIGGIRSLPGAALGAAIVVLIPELLRASGEFRLLLFGVMVIVLAGAGSRGLSGILVDLFMRFSPPRLWLVFQKPGAVRP